MGYGSTVEYTIYSKDTAQFNNVVYFKYQYLKGYQYVREDTINGRMYRYFPDNAKEFLICDMSLNKGDTFLLPSELEEKILEEKIVVDSVVINNGNKNIYFSTFDDWNFTDSIPFAFIEGVGCTYGSGSGILSFMPILCIEKNDTLTYKANENLGCYQNLPPPPIPFVNEIENYTLLKIYPNPVNNKLIIENGVRKMTNTKIYDLLGNEVKRFPINTTNTTLDIHDLQNGMYFIEVETENGKITKKFIKQ